MAEQTVCPTSTSMIVETVINDSNSMMTEIQTIEGGQKNMSSLGGPTLKKILAKTQMMD